MRVRVVAVPTKHSRASRFIVVSVEATRRTVLVLAVTASVIVAGSIALILSQTGVPPSPGWNPPPTEPRWPPPGNASSDLVLTTSTLYPNYASGDAVNIEVRLDNVGSGTESVAITECPAGFLVQDANLSRVYDSLSHASCPGGATNRTLLPGDSIIEYFSWDQRSDPGVTVPSDAWYRVLGYWNGASSEPIKQVGHSLYLGPPASTFRLAFSLRTDRESYSLGETVNVSISLTNVGNGTTVLNFGNPCPEQFVAFDAQGHAIFNSTSYFGCIEVTWATTLAPGASVEWRLGWPLLTDRLMPLPAPATYVLVPSFLMGKLYQPYVVYTDSATITVQS